MKQQPDAHWEEELQTIARTFPYPPTPDLAAAVHQQLQGRIHTTNIHRRLRPLWVSLLALLMLLLGLLTVPPVRAALQAWLQIGAVRIWLIEPTPTPAPTAVAPQPTAPARPRRLSFSLAGETTLAQAEAAVAFPLRLPTYPPDLGEPARVYLQEIEGPVVILVWMEPTVPEQVRLSLHLLGPGAFLWKMQPPVVAGTTVHGQAAIWTEGDYYVKLHPGDQWSTYRLIEGHVLIWTEGEVTYRLETNLSLEEAVRIAESLR